MRNLTIYMSSLTILALVCLSAACRTEPTVANDAQSQAESPTSAADAAAAAPKPEAGAFADATFKAEGRVVALGDVHGDFDAMLLALRRGGLVDERGKWIGGNATFVQTGDLLDRGDEEQQIVDYIEALKSEAAAAGGQVVDLNGNHEVMNVAGDLRYVTPGGFADFEDVEGLDLGSPIVQRFPEHARARMAAFMPGGPYARILARKKVVAVVNDTVFAHGGLLEHHVVYGLDKINSDTSGWMRAERDPPLILNGNDSPIWTRVFSVSPTDCDALQRMLDLLEVKRLVVGHTPQLEGMTSACDGKVWRIDTGMAAHYGGMAAALEIDGDGVEVLAMDPQQ